MSVGRVLGDLFTFLLFVVLSRKFGQEGIGAYSFAIAFTGSLVVFADFGLHNLSIRQMSRNPDSIRQYFGTILAIRIVFSVLVMLAILVIAVFLPFSREIKWVVAIIGFHQMMLTLARGVGTVFAAREQMPLASALECSARIVGALGGSAVAFGLGDLAAAVAVLPVVTALQVAVALWWIGRTVGGLQLSTGWSDVRQTLREVRPFGLGLIVNHIASRLDVVLLGFILGAAAAGVYNVAYRIVFLSLFMPSLASLALFPVISRLAGNAPSQLRSLYHQSLQASTLAGLPAAAGLCLIASDLIDLSFGADFADSALILRWLSWLLLLSCWRNIIAIFLTASDRQSERLRCEWAAALINVIGNGLLIPAVGIIGAALTTLGAEMVLVGLLAARLKASFGWPAIGATLIKSGLATAAFVVPLILLPLPLGFAVPIAVVIYVVALCLFKDIRRDGFRLLSAAIAGRHA